VLFYQQWGENTQGTAPCSGGAFGQGNVGSGQEAVRGKERHCP